MVTSPMLWSRPIPLGNDNDDDGDIDCDGQDDGYDEHGKHGEHDEHGEHGDLADALVKISNDDDDDFGYLAHSTKTSSNHTSYLSFFLHSQIFWKIKFTPKNANFSR